MSLEIYYDRIAKTDLVCNWILSERLSGWSTEKISIGDIRQDRIQYVSIPSDFFIANR